MVRYHLTRLIRMEQKLLDCQDQRMGISHQKVDRNGCQIQIQGRVAQAMDGRTKKDECGAQQEKAVVHMEVPIGMWKRREVVMKMYTHQYPCSHYQDCRQVQSSPVLSLN